MHVPHAGLRVQWCPYYPREPGSLTANSSTSQGASPLRRRRLSPCTWTPFDPRPMSLPPPAPSDDAYSSAVSELSTLISSSSPSLKSHNSASLISTASILSSLTSSHVTIITHVPPIPPYAPLPHVLLASFALARCLVHLGHRCTIITDESYEDQVMAGVIGIGEWAAAGRLTLESFPPGSECGEDEAQVSTTPPPYRRKTAPYPCPPPRTP